MHGVIELEMGYVQIFRYMLFLNSNGNSGHIYM